MEKVSERRLAPNLALRRFYFRVALGGLLVSLASLSLGCLMLAEVHAVSWGNLGSQGAIVQDGAPGETTMTNNAAAGDRVQLTGVYATRGNAVLCPQLKGEDGTMHGVIGLSSDVDLGDRVKVTGRYGVSTRCKGKVLIVEAQEKLGN